MGLLAVDVTRHGVVMSADSQRVEILDGVDHPQQGSRSRNPIVLREGGGFVGVVGFAGTEQLDGRPTRDWLMHFNILWPNDDVSTYCHRLAGELTRVWQRHQLTSVLEILVTGEVGGDVQFWYVRNSEGLHNTDWTHKGPTQAFAAVNDLDSNYIPQHQQPGESKDSVLSRVTFSFRQGVLVPAAPVFDGFSMLLDAMVAGGIPGFAPITSLDDVGQFALMRMEFLKRLCDPTKGISAPNTPVTVGGVIRVFGVGRKGEVREYPKGLAHIKTVRRGRP